MLSKRLLDLRKSRKYSQAQVAMKLGISQGAVSQWEHGVTVPAAEQLVSLANMYGISVDELLGRTEITPTDNKQRLDEKLVEMLVNLQPDQVQRVKDFVAGMKAGKGD